MTLGVLRVILLFALARIAPSLAVHRLVEALGGPDEDTSAAAYMGLVKLGPKTAPRLLQEARRGHHSASILQLIGDQGDRSVIPELETFLSSHDDAIASAAADSIAALREEQPSD